MLSRSAGRRCNSGDSAPVRSVITGCWFLALMLMSLPPRAAPQPSRCVPFILLPIISRCNTSRGRALGAALARGRVVGLGLAAVGSGGHAPRDEDRQWSGRRAMLAADGHGARG